MFPALAGGLFTTEPFDTDEFENAVAEKQLISDGCGVKYIPNCGPLDKWWVLHS